MPRIRSVHSDRGVERRIQWSRDETKRRRFRRRGIQECGEGRHPSRAGSARAESPSSTDPCTDPRLSSRGDAVNRRCRGRIERGFRRARRESPRDQKTETRRILRRRLAGPAPHDSRQSVRDRGTVSRREPSERPSVRLHRAWPRLALGRGSSGPEGTRAGLPQVTSVRAGLRRRAAVRRRTWSRLRPAAEVKIHQLSTHRETSASRNPQLSRRSRGAPRRRGFRARGDGRPPSGRARS